MAQLVEHHLAKVRVAGSNPVVRSIVLDELVENQPALYKTRRQDGDVAKW